MGKYKWDKYGDVTDCDNGVLISKVNFNINDIITCYGLKIPYEYLEYNDTNNTPYNSICEMISGRLCAVATEEILRGYQINILVPYYHKELIRNKIHIRPNDTTLYMR